MLHEYLDYLYYFALASFFFTLYAIVSIRHNTPVKMINGKFLVRVTALDVLCALIIAITPGIGIICGAVGFVIFLMWLAPRRPKIFRQIVDKLDNTVVFKEPR